ncbi:uncharacterized protein LOC116967820 isoform X5 [Amblyraja radiata]|uniref:uncharacterized protein LOC116967820 isoform X5 n=1 Tax=Amblyraja radiata TaxID=386614 RepID=UPI001403BBB1|nr:uncharacterized protein LOC116967820 isoform X5 [Amblyraja radiata]
MDGKKIDDIAPGRLRRLEDNNGVMKSPPSCLKSGNVKVYLKKWSIWDKFYNLGTEMRMSKRGRFMFPYCEYSVSGLDPEKKYIMAMDISPVDSYRYRYNGCKWQINGKATPHVMGRLYFHPNGSVSGKEWMLKTLSFAKLRLTNCPTAEEGNAILHSMHRYIPQFHIIVTDGIIEKLNLNDPRVYTFVFQQTEFFAVTKYENKFIRQLKHFYNPYGTALRDLKTSKQDGVNSRKARKRCEKKSFLNVVKIHDTTNNNEESEQKLKAIIPLKDGAGKTQECTNNQGLMKQMRKIPPVENVLQIKQSFSFEDSQDRIAEIENLEQKLRDELIWNGSHEILHPVLQKSGIKLSGLQITEWLNLKHLGHALYHGHSVTSSEQNAELNYSSFSGAESHGMRESGIPFISRTGKTNDLTKIKGWKNKFNLQPGSPDDKPNPLPSSATTTVIKNRSAFVSDLLDEYLEKEGKIIEQQSLLYDYEMPEIGCRTPNLFDSPCSIQQNLITHSPDLALPPKNKSAHLEMPPVLEKHFSVTNKGIFIRDVQSNSVRGKKRRKKHNSSSVAKRSKIPNQNKNAPKLSIKDDPTQFHVTAPQKKQMKPNPANLKVVHVSSKTKGGKKSSISGSQNEATYISDDKNVEREERCKQLPLTPNKPPDSKTVEIISYCAWNESRVKIIKLIAECAMAKKLPCTQRLDKYEIHVEKREGTLSFSPKKQVDLRATIQNFSDLECVYDKPMVQTMVIEAVVGKSAFKTKLNHLISKASKNNSNQPPVEQISSPVHVVMDVEKNSSSPVKSSGVTSCTASPPNSVTTEDKAQSLPVSIDQKKEDVITATTDAMVKNVPKAPTPSSKSAVTTFQKIGALSKVITRTTLTPTSSCFVNPVVSQNKTETSSTPIRYLLCKTNSSGLSLGPTDSLDQDGRQCSVALPSTLKLQPGENLMLRPVKSADGRQLYKHSSGKVFQLVYTKPPGRVPVQQPDNPQSSILGSSPPVDVLAPSTAAVKGDGNTPRCKTAATSSESYTKNSVESSAGTGLSTSLSPCDVVTHDGVPPQIQSSSKAWNMVDEVSSLQSLHPFPEDTTTEVKQHNRPHTIIPRADCQSKPNSDELNNDTPDLKMEIDPLKLPEPEEYNESPGTVEGFPMKNRGITVTGTYETKWAPEIEEHHKTTDHALQFKCDLDVHNSRKTLVKMEKEVSEINSSELVDPDSSEICAVTVKEEPLNEEEGNSFTTLREDTFRSSKLWNRSFNLNTEAVTEAELGVETHSNSRSRVGFGNLMSKSAIPRNSSTDSKLDVPHRGYFQPSQSSSHSTQRKAFESSVFCQARKKAILHNMRERESRRMMENRFKILKNKLFDDRQIASKGTILDEAVDVITNLDRQSTNLTMEKQLLLGKQKILMEKISLLSVKEEDINNEECSAFNSLKEHCFGSSKFCNFSDFGTDMEPLDNINMDAQEHGDPEYGWSARRKAAHHKLKERESRKLMESRFSILESTVFNNKKAPKGAILVKAINVISDLDMQSDKLSVEKELLMKKQNELLEEISHLCHPRPELIQDHLEDEQFIGAREMLDIQALTFQKSSDTRWLENSDRSEDSLMKDGMVSMMSEGQSDEGVKWEQDEMKVSSLDTIKMAGNLKEDFQELVNTDDFDLSTIRRKSCNGKDEDTFFTAGKESSFGSSDFGSHSDFDLNMDEINEIDVEIMTHSESEIMDFEMEDGEINDGSSSSEKLCAPLRYAEVNHSAELADCPHRDLDFEPFGISGLYAAEVNLLGSHSASELRTFKKSKKNPLLHSLREREWRKLMRKRFNKLRTLLFEDERISKRAILDEGVNEIVKLCQQSQKLCLEKKLLMKKHKALLKIISVLSAEKKLKNEKSGEKNSEDYEHNGAPVSTGQPLSSAAMETSEESTLVPIAGTPFHLLLEKIAVSPQSEELRRISPIDHPEAPGTKGLISRNAMVCHQEETPLTFSEDYLHASPSSQLSKILQRQSKKSGQVHDTLSRVLDVASRNLTTVKDEKEHVNALSQKFKLTSDLLPFNGGQLEKPAQEALFWSKSTSNNSSIATLGKGQTDSRSAVQGKLQVIRSTKGQNILQKLAKKVQEAGIKPWTWKSKREDSENVPQTLFDSASKSIQCFQKASVASVDESPLTPCVYTDMTDADGKNLHRLLPDQILEPGPALNRGELGQMDLDSASSSDSTTGEHAVKEPKIFISSVDIHSANEANANGGYLYLDSAQ